MLKRPYDYFVKRYAQKNNLTHKEAVQEIKNRKIWVEYKNSGRKIKRPPCPEPETYIPNTRTNRCVFRTGKIGKAILQVHPSLELKEEKKEVKEEKDYKEEEEEEEKKLAPIQLPHIVIKQLDRNVDVTNIYDLLDKVGEGGFGQVWLARNRYTGKEVVLKEVRLPEQNYSTNTQLSNFLKQFQEEIELVQGLQCSAEQERKDSDACALVKYYDYFIDKNRTFIYIEMDYFGGGDLFKFIYKYYADTDLVYQVVRRNFIRMVKTVYRMHQMGVLHRDLKPENILLDKNLELAYISDFGLSCIKPNCSYLTGSPPYIDPRLYLKLIKTNDELSDIYALGMTFYTLIIQKHSESILTPQQVENKYSKKAKKVELFQIYEKEYKETYLPALQQKIESYDQSETYMPVLLRIIGRMISPFNRNNVRPSLRSIIEELRGL